MEIHPRDTQTFTQHLRITNRYSNKKRRSILISRSLQNMEIDTPELPAPKKQKCTFMGCTKSFTSPCDLVRHEYIHTGGRPKEHECTYEGCTKSFSYHSDRVSHEYIHTGGRPKENTCTYEGCTKSFYYHKDLVSHEYVHNGGRPKEHKCTFEGCTKSFPYPSGLVSHERSHTGEKPFPCTKCTAVFAHNSALTRHMKIHIRDAQRDMALMEDHHVIETHHTGQSWE